MDLKQFAIKNAFYKHIAHIDLTSVLFILSKTHIIPFVNPFSV